MDPFFAWLSRIFDSWKFWIVIAPWEVGVRVRLGKDAILLKPGFHFRVPFLDSITLVNTRMRIDGTPPVTIQGRAAFHTRYISAVVGYHVADPLKAMMKFGLPQSVVVSKAQGEIALAGDEVKATESLRLYFDENSGIVVDFVKFVEDVEIRTYRLINGSSWSVSGHEGPTGPSGKASERY